jgi:hypothetical protein
MAGNSEAIEKAPAGGMGGPTGAWVPWNNSEPKEIGRGDNDAFGSLGYAMG